MSNEICHLTIGFSGICTHFRNVVPGVPHRVVLGNAYEVRFGVCHLPEPDIDINYCLLPHFPMLIGSGKTLSVENLISENFILKPLRLQLKNAIDTTLEYDESAYARVPAVAGFVTDYQVSEEVVFGGRAMCYLDVFAGKISTSPKNNIERVTITVATDGVPTFVVTPFSSDQPPVELQVPGPLPPPFGTSEYGVTLACIEQIPEEYGYDFLLHYLTSARGIPRALTKPPLGMPPIPKWMTPEDLQRCLSGLAAYAGVGWPYFSIESAPPPGQTGPACSDTRYP